MKFWCTRVPEFCACFLHEKCDGINTVHHCLHKADSEICAPGKKVHYFLCSRVLIKNGSCTKGRWAICSPKRRCFSSTCLRFRCKRLLDYSVQKWKYVPMSTCSEWVSCPFQLVQKHLQNRPIPIISTYSLKCRNCNKTQRMRSIIPRVCSPQTNTTHGHVCLWKEDNHSSWIWIVIEKSSGKQLTTIGRGGSVRLHGTGGNSKKCANFVA